MYIRRLIHTHTTKNYLHANVIGIPPIFDDVPLLGIEGDLQVAFLEADAVAEEVVDGALGAGHSSTTRFILQQQEHLQIDQGLQLQISLC